MCLLGIKIVTVNQHCLRSHSYLVLALVNWPLLWILTSKEKFKVFMATAVCIWDLPK